MEPVKGCWEGHGNCTSRQMQRSAKELLQCGLEASCKLSNGSGRTVVDG